MPTGGSSRFTDSEVYLLHEIVLALDRQARVLSLDALGLTYAEFLVAVMVRELVQPSQREVADQLGYSNSMISQRAASLREKGFIEQNRDPHSRRIVRLRLTMAGAKVLDRASEELTQQASGLFAHLGDQRESFRHSLANIREILRAAEN